MAQLSLTLLGGLEARAEPGGTLSLPTRKAQAMLAYLALPPGQAHPRAKLAALLWGGIREESARNSLRQALFALRKALSTTPTALSLEGDTVALDRDAAVVDVAEFERLLANPTPERLERASALYRGDLLMGLVVDEPLFEEWLVGERERLRELALDGLARLLAQQRKAGTSEAALQTGLKLLTLDPLQESVHRALMRLYAAVGRRGTALRQYQQCVNVLQRDLGIEPEAETKQLYQEILHQRPSRGSLSEPAVASPSLPTTVLTSRAPADQIPLIGRAVELEVLRGALQHAYAGKGGLVAVLGEAGIGKTRLVDELIGLAEELGARVMVGRSYESEQILPFGPWVDAFRAAHATEDLRGMAPALRAELAHVLPELAGPDVGAVKSAPDFLKVFESVTAAIGILSGHRPLLLVLEDLHWADEMTLRLLAFFGRRLHSRRVLVVVTAREEELADTPMLRRIFGELQRERRLSSLTLVALSRDNTLALVHTLVRSGTDEKSLAQLGEEAWRTSAGNPFVAVETVRSEVQGIGLGDHTTGAGLGEPRALRLPEAVRYLVTRRLESLSERGRLLTTVAAVIGREFEFALLQRAAGLGNAEAAEGMEELVRRRVLHGVGERFDFTHDRIREVACAALLAPRRRVLHGSVAEAIEAVYADNLEPHILALGLHYYGAERWSEAVSYLRRAASLAFVRSAYREAATCYEQTLAAASHLPRTPAILNQMLDLQLQLRNALWPLAEFDRIARCLSDAEQLAISLEDKERLGRITAFMSVLRWVTGDAGAARLFGQRARDLAVSLEDRPLRIMSNYYLGLAQFLLGAYRGAEDLFLENVRTLTIAEEQDPLGAPGSTLIRSQAWLVLPLAERGAFLSGLDNGHAALKLAEAAEDPYGIVSASYCLAYLYCLKGEFDLAIPSLERALTICREREFGVWLPQVTGYLGHAYSLAGRIDEGLALLGQAIDVFEATHAWPFRALLVVHRGTADVLAGRLDSALAQGREALKVAREHDERGHEAWAVLLLGEIAAHSDPSEVKKAEDHYHRAMALASNLGMRPLIAHCRLALGRLYRRAGDRRSAQEHLAAAMAMYREMDMQFWLEKAERESA